MPFRLSDFMGHLLSCRDLLAVSGTDLCIYLMFCGSLAWLTHARPNRLSLATSSRGLQTCQVAVLVCSDRASLLIIARKVETVLLSFHPT